MPRTVDRPSVGGRSQFRGALRWLLLSVVGIVIAAGGIILRITTGEPGSYDVVFSFGMFLVIVGVVITGLVARREQLK